MLSGIIGTIKAAFFRFDNCIDPVRIGTGNSDTDLAEDPFGQAIPLEAFPSNAIIVRSVEPSPWTAAGKKPGLLPSLSQ